MAYAATGAPPRSARHPNLLLRHRCGRMLPLFEPKLSGIPLQRTNSEENLKGARDWRAVLTRP